MYRIALPKAAEYIINTLNDKGFEAFIVGGCVRDCLLNKVPKDWDITTSALPEQVKAAFDHTYDTGIQHGTITVLMDKVGYEVTTYRIDGEYKDNRHPESVIFTENLEGDLARRDFTMNAIAYSPRTGIVDCFNGIEDIKNKLIRAVGDPDKRFGEDALRMMRALRFSAQLGFDIEEETYKAIIRNKHLIKNISMERVRDELLKLILSPEPLKVFDVKNTGIADYVLLPLKAMLDTRQEEIKKYLPEINPTATERLAFILRTTEEKPLEGFLKDLRLDNRTLRDIITLVRHINTVGEEEPYEIRCLIRDTTLEMAELITKLRSVIFEADKTKTMEVINEVREKNYCCSLKGLAVAGSDLMEAGMPKGRELGEALAYCLDLVLKNPQNNSKEYLLNEVHKKYIK